MTQAIVTLISGMQFAVETGTGHTFIIDSDRPEVGGRGTGPRAIELMVASVAGCTAMDVISILRKMQQKVTDLQVQVTTKDAEEHPKKFLEVHIEYRVTGFQVAEDRVKRAIQLSEEKYCPAMAALRPGTTLTHSYQIKEAEESALLK